MTDEQINQLFDLKQKLDAGIITKEAFDKEVSVLKGEKQPDVSQEEYSPEKEDKLAQLDELYNLSTGNHKNITWEKTRPKNLPTG